MLPGKAVFLLLVVSGVVCLDSVSGKMLCNEHQKKDILVKCHEFVKKHNTKAAAKDSPCCELVRQLQSLYNYIMMCISDLLTERERKDYDRPSIVDLKLSCLLPAPSAPK